MAETSASGITCSHTPVFSSMSTLSEVRKKIFEMQDDEDDNAAAPFDCDEGDNGDD